jgi:hypothetical protein
LLIVGSGEDSMAKSHRRPQPVIVRDPKDKLRIKIPAPSRRGAGDPVVNRHAPVFKDKTKYSRKGKNKKEES